MRIQSRTTRSAFGFGRSGNLASDTGSLGDRTYCYDDFNRLASYYVGGSLKGWYKSNAYNQRAWKWNSTGSGHTHEANHSVAGDSGHGSLRGHVAL